MLGSFAGIIILAFIRYDIFRLMDYVPFRFWEVIDNDNLRLTLIWALVIYFIVSVKLMNTRFLQIAWWLIAAFNIASIIRYTFLYFTWKPPLVDQYLKSGTKLDPVKLIMAYTSPMHASSYLIMMIYPLCWVIICTISLLKIRKEKQLSPAL